MKTCRALNLILIYAFFLFFSKTSAQLPPLKITHIGTENGLSQGSVYAIHKDSRGIVWFGTQDGLNAYVGKKVKLIGQKNNSKKGHLIGNRISGIVEDQEGMLWIGTANALNKYNYFTDEFINYFVNQEVFPLAADQDYIWVWTSKNGYVKLHKKSGKWQVFYKEGKFNSNYTSSKNSSIIVSQNEYWLQTNDGIIHFKNGVSKYYFSRSSKNIIGKPLTITKIKIFREKLYISSNQGLYILDFKNDSLEKLSDPELNLNVLIFDFDISKDGKIWLASDQKGLLIYDLNSKITIEFSKNETSQNRLYDSNISNVYIDPENTVWLNTDPYGVDKIQVMKANFEFLNLNFPDKIPNNIRSQSIRSIIEYDNNELWLGTLNAGIWVVDKSTKKTIKSFVNIGNQNPLPNNHIKFLLKSENNSIWIATESGLAKYENKTIKTYKLPHYKNVNTGTFIRSLEKFNDKLYISTEEGVVIYDERQGKFIDKRIFQEEKTTFTYHLSEKKWFLGTFDKGLLLIENGKIIKRIPLILPTFIRNLESKNQLFVGTDVGLYIIDNQCNVISIYNKAKGLKNDFLYAGELDKKGNLWVSSNKGIIKIDPANLKSYNFNLNDGLQDFEFNGFSSYKNTEGYIYFGGIKGLNKFNPSQIEISDEPILNTLHSDSKNLKMIFSQSFLDMNSEFKSPDLQDKRFVNSFKKLSSDIPNHSYSTKAIWLKFKLKNNAGNKWYLEIENTRLNKIEMWVYEKGNLVSKKIGGDILPLEKSDFRDPNPIFELDLIENQEYEIFLRAESNRDLKLPISIWEESAIAEHISNRKLIWGIYVGFILLIAFYNLFLWLSIRDNTYLFYMFYVISFGLFQFAVYGLFKEYIWANSSFNEYAFILFLFISNIFLFFFTEKFLDLITYLPHWQLLKRIMLGILLIVIILTPFLFNSYFNYVAIYLSSFYNLIYLYIFWVYIKLNQKIIYYYVLAISFLSIASIIVALQNLALINAKYQEYIIMGGSMLEIILFSLTLGYKFRINLLEKERQQQMRNEISSNLHDDLAASLSSLTMYTELSKRKLSADSTEIIGRLDNITAKSRDILNKVRSAVYEINPKNDAEEEWLERIISFGVDIFESKGIEFLADIDPKFKSNAVSVEKRRQIFLIFKEAMNNAAKYSEAKQITLKIYIEIGSKIISLKDDGKGIGALELQKGNGMANMKTRAKNIQGNLEIIADQNGTEIRLTL